MFARLQTLLASRGSIATAALVLALTLVSATPASSQTTPEKQHDQAPVKLVVKNDNFLNVHIYAERDGYAWPLGYVDGLSEGTLNIPRDLIDTASEFQLRVDPVGSTLSYTTNAILLGSGHEIDLTVASDLGFTTFSVR